MSLCIPDRITSLFKEKDVYVQLLKRRAGNFADLRHSRLLHLKLSA